MQFDAYMKHFGTVVYAQARAGEADQRASSTRKAPRREDLEQLATAAAQAGNSNASIMGQTALQSVMQVRLYANKLIGRHDQARSTRSRSISRS